MAADWEEVKRLAADFQKAQLSSTLQRLSDRNCIEIVTKLIELNLLDVIFTNDGKEYLTPQQVSREIKDELYVRGGRVNLVDLSKEVNVELSHITVRVAEICQQNKNIKLVLGQLIDDNYVTRIAREINEKLIQIGQITVSDLTLQYDLPAEFLLHSVLEKHLGKLIQAKQDPTDPRIFFTEAFVSRSKARLRGALAALSRPTPVAAIINQCNIPERLFFTLMKEISSAGSVTGKQTGAQYIPHVYSKSQLEWVVNSYKQSGYLEYESLTRMGISDPKGFIKRSLVNEDINFLQSCAIGNQITEQVATAIEECNSTKTFVDVCSLLPSVISEDDVADLINKATTPSLLKNLHVFGSTVVSTNYIEKLSTPCYDLVKENAKQYVESGGYQRLFTEKQATSKGVEVPDASSHVDLKAERRDERRRKAVGGKGGGGTQGRETKTKSVKKHQRSKQNAPESDSDDDTAANAKKSNPSNVELVSIKDIKKSINGALESDGIEYLVSDLAHHLILSVNKVGMAEAQKIFESTIENTSQNRRQTHSSLQDKLNILINDIKHYEKGIKLFPGDQQLQFIKYLLKSLGGDIASEFFKYAANECGIQVTQATLAMEQRNKMLNDVSDEYKSVLTALNKSLSGPSIDEFLQCADNCLEACSMVMKKVDKKKDKSLVVSHRMSLLEQLSSCNDPSLVLHLASLVLFTSCTHAMLHASGRHVSTILSFLSPNLTDPQRKELSDYHDLVLKVLSSEEDSSEKEDAQNLLQERMINIKRIVENFKKSPNQGVE